MAGADVYLTSKQTPLPAQETQLTWEENLTPQPEVIGVFPVWGAGL